MANTHAHMNTDIIITRTFDDGRPNIVMKFAPRCEYDATATAMILTSPTALDAMNFAALLFCVRDAPPGYDAWEAVERLGLARHFVDVTPAPAEPAVKPEPSYYTEGDRCPECGGSFHYPKVENCSCHISPPCGACVDNALECDQCGLADLTKPQQDAPINLLAIINRTESLIE